MTQQQASAELKKFYRKLYRVGAFRFFILPVIANLVAIVSLPISVYLAFNGSYWSILIVCFAGMLYLSHIVLNMLPLSEAQQKLFKQYPRWKLDELHRLAGK